MRTEIRSREEKISVASAGLYPGSTTKSVCSDYDISPSTYRRWRRQILHAVPRLTPGTLVEEKSIAGGHTRYRAINYQYATLTMLNPVGYWICKLTNGVRTVLDLAKELIPKLAARFQGEGYEAIHSIGWLGQL